MSEGHRDDWKTDETARFEYHCNRAHDSADARLWYRSHRTVQVLAVDGEGGGDTLEERLEAGNPRSYLIRFADGEEGGAFEDELFDHARHLDPAMGPPSDDDIRAAGATPPAFDRPFRNHVRLHADCLWSKHGFGDGRALDHDNLDEGVFDSLFEAAEAAGARLGDHDALVLAVRRHLLPAIAAFGHDVAVVEIGSSHNPIRAADWETPDAMPKDMERIHVDLTADEWLAIVLEASASRSAAS